MLRVRYQPRRHGTAPHSLVTRALTRVWRRREWHCCTLQSSNEIGGRLFAELTHELFSQLATAKYVKTEYRISVYGSSANDWKSVA